MALEMKEANGSLRLNMYTEYHSHQYVIPTRELVQDTVDASSTHTLAPGRLFHSLAM